MQGGKRIILLRRKAAYFTPVSPSICSLTDLTLLIQAGKASITAFLW